MKKSRFSESQIVRILKEVEGGRMVKEVCREYGMSDATYYNWKAKYGGMEASDIKRLNELEKENQRLKQMYAELSLENRVLKDVIEKKALKLGEKRELVDFAIQAHGMSIRGACVVFGISRTVYRYQPDETRDESVIQALQELAERFPRYGFGKMFPIFRWHGEAYAGTKESQASSPPGWL